MFELRPTVGWTQKNKKGFRDKPLKPYGDL